MPGGSRRCKEARKASPQKHQRWHACHTPAHCQPASHRNKQASAAAPPGRARTHLQHRVGGPVRVVYRHLGAGQGQALVTHELRQAARWLATRAGHLPPLQVCTPYKGQGTWIDSCSGLPSRALYFMLLHIAPLCTPTCDTPASLVSASSSSSRRPSGASASSITFRIRGLLKRCLQWWNGCGRQWECIKCHGSQVALGLVTKVPQTAEISLGQPLHVLVGALLGHSDRHQVNLLVELRSQLLWQQE